MKVLLAAKPKVRGAFQCNKCSSILEVHEHDMNSEEEFECPICKKVNHIEESINVDFLLTMRGIRDEITSDNLEIRITRYQAHVYYKDLDIGYISYGTRVKNGLHLFSLCVGQILILDLFISLFLSSYFGIIHTFYFPYLLHIPLFFFKPLYINHMNV